MGTEVHWTAYVTALLTPIVAISAAWIAYRQSRIAENKLKFDLFERRFKVYEATRDFVGSVVTTGKVKDDEFLKFMIATREAKWLFDDKVHAYLQEDIYQKASQLSTHGAMLDGMPRGEERTKNVTAQTEIKQWFLAQYDVVNEQFSPFLQLGH